MPAGNDAVASEKKSNKKPRSGIAGRSASGVLPAGAAAAVDTSAGKRGDKKLRKGTRGTEMSEDFE
jgi:hypothetical protein